jgi:hypothetical protein
LERWTFQDQTWAREADGQSFRLLDFRGSTPAAGIYEPDELARLVGARREGDALYPGPFRHSPNTGQPLPPPPNEIFEEWLPPFGNAGGALPRGLRQTRAKLSLPLDARPEQDPDVNLPLPPAGDYQFLVGNFSARCPGLIALETRKGLVYLYRDACQRWEELPPERHLLPASSLPPGGWGLACPEPGGRRFFLPTDQGLAALDFHRLALRYALTLFPAPCLGAPVFWRQSVYAPASRDDGGLGILQTDPAKPERSAWLAPAFAAPAGRFAHALVDRRQVVWLGLEGQLTLGLAIDGEPRPAYFPWPQGIRPCFEFGSPYHARDGVFWQLCFDEAAQRYRYVALGRANPESWPTSRPRICSGTMSFTLETMIEDDPWHDPELAEDAQADELVAPLLEAANKTVLCLRVPWTVGADRFFQSLDKHRTAFELIGGGGDSRFFVKNLVQPWLTRPFVYRGYLYLYHPSLKESAPGWRLLAA